jgi:polyhydroxyalkanoate synthesis regulator phasin
MPTSKSSGRSARSKASTARKASSTGRRSGGSEPPREQLQRLLDPREVIVVTRERLQEVLDEAVARGRMTRDDASTLLTDLLARGRDDVEALLSGARATTRRGVAGSAERVLREVDRARRVAGVGPSFPILGYDDLTAAQVNERLEDLGAPELRKVRDYEKRNANRKSVLAAIERKLK